MKHLKTAMLATALVTLSSAAAQAQPYPRTFSDGRPTMMVGALVGVGTGSHHAHEMGSAWALHGDVFVHPWVTVGLIGGRSTASGNDGERLEVDSVHARATLRPFARWVIDPWVGLEAGYTALWAGMRCTTPPGRWASARGASASAAAWAWRRSSRGGSARG
jgi:hypothetical protein